MKSIDRRDFLGGVLASGATLAVATLPAAEAYGTEPASSHAAQDSTAAQGSTVAHGTASIDFRYSPVEYQTAFCFPDDKHKSLVSQAGALLYGWDAAAGINYFPLKVSFGVHGMRAPKAITQRLESPAIPIVYTTIEYPGLTVTLTTFATNEAGEGRVDNVIFEAAAQDDGAVDFEPVVDIDSAEEFDFEKTDGVPAILHRKTRLPLLLGKVMVSRPPSKMPGDGFTRSTYRGQQLALHRGQASKATAYRAFFRFPQEGQQKGSIVAGLAEPEQILQSCRTFWSSWKAFHEPVAWAVPGRQGEFVQACARNILQAREVREGRLTFQVGPTCYRGLWVVDGNFILEAARYMGLDKEAIEGLHTTWAAQLGTGQVPGAGGKEHWKDTAIAMFTLVRQCELSQDWGLLHQLEPQVVHGIEFLRSLQTLAVSQGSALGRYGLLAKGFADGGMDGIRDELTNTVWVLAGLKAMAEAAETQHMDSLKGAGQLYAQLQSAFAKAAPQEMRRYETGFDYLPMLLKNDPDWEAADPWDRPRPQSAQWALSHAIFPGRVFDAQSAIVRGHTRLMQAVAQEGIPAETGWGRHHSVWGYNSAFVAQVYLWLGMRQAAHDTFIGFLNHASPQYCWREEQPLQDAFVMTYVGDMPHNWASAECVRFVRHMLALEDGAELRLLAGVTAAELAAGKPYALTATPTRFGRLDLKLEPLHGGQGWRLSYERAAGPAPENVSLPARLGDGLQFVRMEGAHSRVQGDGVSVEPSASRWSAFWKA
jgi:hypothetical protein